MSRSVEEEMAGFDAEWEAWQGTMAGALTRVSAAFTLAAAGLRRAFGHRRPGGR